MSVHVPVIGFPLGSNLQTNLPHIWFGNELNIPSVYVEDTLVVQVVRGVCYHVCDFGFGALAFLYQTYLAR